MTRAHYVPPSTGSQVDYNRSSANAVNALSEGMKTTVPTNVKLMGALGDGQTDDTAAITTALTNYDDIYIPAGTFIVSTINVPTGKQIRTAGFKTILKQKSGTASSTRILTINASNVQIGDIALEGQLNQAGDTTGEQNHGIFVNASTADISTITLGNVKGTNIRGDVVYIGQSAGYFVSHVIVGNVTGANVYRNVVSVVSGSSIKIASIAGTQVGYMHFDIEADVGTGPTSGVQVGYIKGRYIGAVSPTAADYIDAVTINSIDLNPSYTTGSTPAYGPGASLASGLQIRNCASLTIQTAKISGFNGPGVLQIYNGGELTGQSLKFGVLTISSCSLTDAINYGYVTGNSGVTLLTVGTLKATVSANKAALLNCDNAVISSCQASNASTAGLFRSCVALTANNLTHTGAGAVFVACDGLSGTGGSVAATAGTLCSFSAGVALVNYTLTATTVFNAVTNGQLINSTINGTFYNQWSNGAFNVAGTGVANALTSYQVNGTSVVGAQQPLIANDASGAANQATVNAILTALRTHGLIAT